MKPEEARARGDRAKIAYEELGASFDAVLGGYLTRLSDVAAAEPWAADKLRSLALAQRIGLEVKAHMLSLMAGTPIAQAEIQHRRKIEAMSPERRQILGIPLP